MAKPTYQDYVDAGVLEPKPVKPSWLVRTKAGRQFCTPASEEAAKEWATRIEGTYEWYTPIQAPTIQIGQTYDH